MGCRELFLKSQGHFAIRIMKNLGELRKDLVADGGQFVSQLGPLLGEFVAMLHEASQLRGGWGWWQCPSDQLHFVGDLGTQFQLGVEPVGQAKSITLVSLHHPLGALLHMDPVDGYIQVQQVLFEVFVIVAGVLKQDRGLLNGYQFPNAVDESAEAFP